MIEKIISGAQTGADQAGLYVGKLFGLQTGGTMPKGFLTLSGNRPDFFDKYGVVEHESILYPPRTELNVKNSDGTARFAQNFNSSGEKCTKKFIDKHRKNYFDVDLSDPPPIQEFINWIETNKIKTLNVAGNSEQTCCGAFEKTKIYLMNAFFEMGFSISFSSKNLIKQLGLSEIIGFYFDGNLIENIELKKRT